MIGAAPARAPFLAQHCHMPFCKGCGHTHVIRKLGEALAGANLSPENVCLVTYIGCIGLADGLFPAIHTVHTTHGRSTAFATGIELADGVLHDSRLKTIVLIGDGGAMIGLLHLVNAALLNVDVTVLLCNNFLFGMTGGQNSAFSPLEFNTPTTPRGNIVPPIDMCRLLIDAHAPFVARKLATDHDLAPLIRQAVETPGFSLVEIVELCTEYGTPKNELTGNALAKIIREHGQELGVLKASGERKSFESQYASKFPRTEQEPDTEGIMMKYSALLRKKIGIFLAGSAGERVQSSAAMFCEAAVASGLHCTQKNDNPVTQGSGFSLSEVCLSPREIHYTGIDRPDVLIAVSREGLDELTGRGIVEKLTSGSVLLIDDSLPAPETRARVWRFPFRSRCGVDKAAIGALMFALHRLEIYPSGAFDEICRARYTLQEAPFPAEFFSAAADHR